MINIEDSTQDMENTDINEESAESECSQEPESASDQENVEEGSESSGYEADDGSGDPDDQKEAGESEADDSPDSDKDKKSSSQVEELKDRLMRQMAEFDNYRKRTEKEKKANYEIGAADFITKILPVVDNFERGFDALENRDSEDPFVTGMDMIYKQFLRILEDEGVKPIEAVGKPFDPTYHNAVMQQENEEYESGTVINEFQKGYIYKDRVLRHSMVVVAQ